jgi:phage N-6-adenine-methyltransferase
MRSHVPTGNQNLPAGFLDALEEATGSSRSELKNRRQFAEDFGKDQLANAVSQKVSWHVIVNELLGSRGADDGAWEREEHSAETEEWETPQDLFDDLNTEFGFELDVCSAPELAKCERFFSPDDNGLRRTWRGVCWMNPPHGYGIEQWVAKARRAAENDRATTIVCLLPARVDASWWWENCLAAEIRFLPGRLRLGRRDAPWPSAIVIFGRKSKVVWWDR